MGEFEREDPRTHMQPLAKATALRRALESLGVQATWPPAGVRNPWGERGDAAQYLGVLTAVTEQMASPLHGGELHGDMRKGYFTGYNRDLPAMLGALADRLGYDAGFAQWGAEQVPRASNQLVTAASLLAEDVEHLDKSRARSVAELTREAFTYGNLLADVQWTLMTTVSADAAGPVLRWAHLTYSVAAHRQCWWLSVLADPHGPEEVHWFPRGPLPPSTAARTTVLSGWGLRPWINHTGAETGWEWNESLTDDSDRSRPFAWIWVEPIPAATDDPDAEASGDEARPEAS